MPAPGRSIAPKWDASSAAPIAIGIIGRSRCPALATPAPVCFSSDSRPERTAPIAPGACSPATARAIFFTRCCSTTGFASQPTSVSRDDGLKLIDAYISAAVRCAPPDNKPTVEEIRTCRPYLERELELLETVQVIVALGRLAFDVYLGILRDQGKIARRSGFRVRSRCGTSHRRRPAAADQFLPSEPAEHVHRQTYGGDVSRGLSTRAAAPERS